MNLTDRNAEYTSTIDNLKADIAKLIELGWNSVGDVDGIYSRAVDALENVVHFNEHVLERNRENMMLQADADRRHDARLRDSTQIRDI